MRAAICTPPRLLQLALLLAARCASSQPAPPPETLVWPLHGTSGDNGVGGWASSEVPTGAQAPFGSMRLGPDTTVCWAGVDWFFPYNHYGGYFFNDSCIRAFSHSHAQGTGLGDAGSLGVTLTRAPLTAASALPSAANPAPFRSNFSHANETSVAGHYSVWLADASARAEVTVAGMRSGLHRYTCAAAAGAPCVLVADGCNRVTDDACGPGVMTLAPGAGSSLALGASLTEDGAFAHDCGGVPIFLSARIDAVDATGAAAAPQSLSRWADGALLAGGGSVNSSGASGSLGAAVTWAQPPAGGALTITVRVGVSYVSLAAAAANLAAEQRDAGTGAWLPFDAAVARVRAQWSAALSTVTVNDVGYSDADVAAHRARLGTDTAAALAARALHAVPGAAPSDAGRARALSMARASALAALAAGRIAGVARNASAADALAAATADGGAALLDAMLARAGPSAASRAAAAAGGGAAAMGLGLPPHPIGMPPAERLGSFYSSLYHALCSPTVYSDADGAYTGLDRAVHTASWRGGAGAFVSDLSLWDVYRSQTPLLAIVAPEAASDLFFSSIADYNATGQPAHWVWANCETGCMPGSHGVAVLVDYLVKGLPGPPPSAVFAAAAAALARQDADDGYNSRGYVAVDVSENGASLTLDYAFDDAVGALAATLAGNASAAALWGARAQNYRNVWSSELGGMYPRLANGSFLSPPPPPDLPPVLLNSYFTEGDGLQYTYSVPHDVEGLRSLFASDAAFVSLLQQQMANTSMWPINALPNPWYWAGNEPGLLSPWLFSLVPTDAWRSQYWIRWILDVYYQLTPDGVPGNDDLGETNSWAVWACLGLYPLTATPGGTYILSSPCFANVTLALPPAAARHAGYAHAAAAAATPLITIVAHNFSVANVYVARAVLNGVDLPTPFVNHSQLLPPLRAPRTGEAPAEHAARIAAGAGASLLEFFLTSVPMEWGTGRPARVPDW